MEHILSFKSSPMGSIFFPSIEAPIRIENNFKGHLIEQLSKPKKVRQYTSLLKSPYSKACLKRSLKNNNKLVCNYDCRLMQVKSIAECSKGSILQYFRTSLRYHFSLRPLFCLFLSGRLRQVLLYFDPTKNMWLKV